MTAFLFLRPAPASEVHEDAPEGREPQTFDPSLDADALSWLGFAPGEPDEPLLPWERPQRWRAPRLRTGGRHRFAAPFRTA